MASVDKIDSAIKYKIDLNAGKLPYKEKVYLVALILTLNQLKCKDAMG